MSRRQILMSPCYAPSRRTRLVHLKKQLQLSQIPCIKFVVDQCALQATRIGENFTGICVIAVCNEFQKLFNFPRRKQLLYYSIRMQPDFRVYILRSSIFNWVVTSIRLIAIPDCRLQETWTSLFCKFTNRNEPKYSCKCQKS